MEKRCSSTTLAENNAATIFATPEVKARIEQEVRNLVSSQYSGVVPVLADF